MGLDNTIDKFYQMKEKGYSQGLTYRDYCELIRMKRELESKGINNDKSKEIYNDICSVMKYMSDSGATKKFSNNNKNYIKENALLLPLLVTDTKGGISLSGKNTIEFNCVFHEEDEDKRSLLLKDMNNSFVCKECGTKGDVIDYVRSYHRLRMFEALEFLCRVYKFKIPFDNPLFRNPDIEYLANGYSEVFKYDICDELLDKAEQRLYDKGIQDFDGVSVESIYNKRRELLKRVRSGEYDPNFKYDRPKKYILLPKEK